MVTVMIRDVNTQVVHGCIVVTRLWTKHFSNVIPSNVLVVQATEIMSASIVIILVSIKFGRTII